MPNLTVKQERFAQFVAKGDNQSDAYRQAYNAENMTDKSIHEKASVLANDVKVRARIDELLEQMRISAGISKEYITKEILDDIRQLKTDGQVNYSAQRLMDLAKLHGLITDKKELSGGVDVKHQSLPWEKMYKDGDAKS